MIPDKIKRMGKRSGINFSLVEQVEATFKYGVSESCEIVSNDKCACYRDIFTDGCPAATLCYTLGIYPQSDDAEIKSFDIDEEALKKIGIVDFEINECVEFDRDEEFFYYELTKINDRAEKIISENLDKLYEIFKEGL